MNNGFLYVNETTVKTTMNGTEYTVMRYRDGFRVFVVNAMVQAYRNGFATPRDFATLEAVEKKYKGLAGVAAVFPQIGEADKAAPAFAALTACPWTVADHKGAGVEGWELDDLYGVPLIAAVNTQGLEPEALDPVFANDDDALAHVRQRAADGSELHTRALAIHEKAYAKVMQDGDGCVRRRAAGETVR
jgi:hypothetical protein